MLPNLRADILEARKVNAGPGWFDRHVGLFFQFGVLAVIHYRYRRWARSFPVPVVRPMLRALGQVGSAFVRVLSGVDISPDADIGPGFVIHTAHGVFVGPVKIGANCIVQHGVSLSSGTAVGDNVYFGPGAKVIGRASIGNNVVVVANSLVMTDVEDDTTVVGVPARIRLPRGTDDRGRSMTRRRPD